MTCKTHEHHDHVHGANCGHTAIKHEATSIICTTATCTMSITATTMNTP